MIRKGTLRFYGLCAILAGITCGIFKYLTLLTPAPLTYDDYNRLFTLPLLLVFIGTIGIYNCYIKLISSKAALVMGATIVISTFLLFLGNVVEFWIVLLQDKPNAYEAY